MRWETEEEIEESERQVVQLNVIVCICERMKIEWSSEKKTNIDVQ